MSKLIIIRNEGGSRVISITSVIPKDWQAIEITQTKKSNDSVTLKIDKVK
jgi:hypothetical protein